MTEATFWLPDWSDVSPAVSCAVSLAFCGGAGGFVSTGFIRLRVSATLAVLWKPDQARCERPSAAEKEQQNQHRGEDEAGAASLAARRLGRLRRRRFLGGASISMSSSIALAEKYLSLGSFWRAFRITASISGEILLFSLRGGVGSLCMCCLARLLTSPENGGLPVRQW